MRCHVTWRLLKDMSIHCSMYTTSRSEVNGVYTSRIWSTMLRYRSAASIAAPDTNRMPSFGREASHNAQVNEYLPYNSGMLLEVCSDRNQDLGRFLQVSGAKTTNFSKL